MGVVICAGRYRGGSTLQFNLARRLVEVVGVGRGRPAQGGLSKEPLKAAVERDTWEVVKIHALGDLAAFYTGFDEHAAARQALIGAQAQSGGVGLPKLLLVSTHRDPRDVVVSAMGFEALTYYDALAGAWEMEQAHQELRFLFLEHVHEIAYRALRGCARHHLSELAAILGVRMDSGVRDEIVRETGIEAAEEICTRLSAEAAPKLNGRTFRDVPPEERGGFVQDLATGLHYNHIGPNQGRDGAWPYLLAPWQVRSIEAVFAPMMHYYGYAEESADAQAVDCDCRERRAGRGLCVRNRRSARSRHMGPGRREHDG